MEIKKFQLSLLMFLTAIFTAYAENDQNVRKPKTDANIIGHVVEKETGEHLPGVAVMIEGTSKGTVTDATGHYRLLDLPVGKITLKVRVMGYQTVTKKVTLVKNKTCEVNFELEEDMMALDAVVVSSNRNETTRRMAPTLVSVIDAKKFTQVNAVNLAQGVVFQPGVRVENNCQNCGFNQIRINGMDGRYTQILIDSRPVMSALAGVYGLEQIPANMIERVELIRGGGSALYGSSAIAGVLNIITKDPLYNSFSVTESLGFTGMKDLDNNLSFNGAFVSDDQKAGAMVFGSMRYRKPWDYNDDGSSEISKIDSRSLGSRFFFRTSDYSRIVAEIHSIHEFRRGGDHINEGWPPHVAEIAEQIEHSIYSGNIKFDWRSRNTKHHLQAYASGQMINRESYYGGSDVLGEDGKPNLVPNGDGMLEADKTLYGDNYGHTKGRTYNAGFQYSYDADKLLFMPAEILAGAEYTHDQLNDIMPIRSWMEVEGQTFRLHAPIEQKLDIWSQFAQVEWKNDMFSMLFGYRLDKHSMLDDPIFSPRATFRFNPTRDINLRATYSSGFRAPQVFDEDLHVGICQGEAQKIVNAPGLKKETSNSFNLSADMYHRFGEVQANLLIEGFYTRLKDAFTLVEMAEQPSDDFVLYERDNAGGAKVFGANFEARLAYRNVQLQMGFTLTSNKYDDPVEWGVRTGIKGGAQTAMADGSDFEKDAEGNFMNYSQESDKITRTPENYGYFMFSWEPFKHFNFSLTGNYTGKMKVPHIIEWGVGAAESDIKALAAGLRTPGITDASGNAARADILEEAPAFFELGTKVSYEFHLSQVTRLQVFAGMNNIFDSFQDDFDRGKYRQSDYIYGPTQPRTVYAGCTYSF